MWIHEGFLGGCRGFEDSRACRRALETCCILGLRVLV